MGLGDDNNFPRIQVSSSRSLQFKMAELEISVVGENVCATFGEGPHWDTKTQKLFWVDCLDYSVHVLDVDTGEVKEVYSTHCSLAQILRSVRFHSRLRHP